MNSFSVFDFISSNVDELIAILMLIGRVFVIIDEVLSINTSVMFLSFKTITPIIRTDLPILVELIDLVNSNNLTQMVNFLTRIPDYDSHSPALLDFFLLALVFVLQWLSLHREILTMLLSQFLLTFYQIHNMMPCFIPYLMTILVLTGMVFAIICEMFHGRITQCFICC